MFPALRNNAAAGCQGPALLLELLKGAGLLKSDKLTEERRSESSDAPQLARM